MEWRELQVDLTIIKIKTSKMFILVASLRSIFVNLKKLIINLNLVM